MKKYSIFGGTGYVGTYLQKSVDGFVIDRNSRTPLSPAVIYLLSTTDNYSGLDDLHIDIDTNLSILVDVLHSWRSRLLRAQKTHEGVFNYISTWFVYGKNSTLPVDENAYTNPNGFYSITKLCAEQLVRSFCETNGLNYRILRLCSVCGGVDPRASKKKNALHSLVKDIAANKECVYLYHNGNFLRSYMHVKDVCEAIKLVCETGELNTIYNIAPDQPSIFIDLIQHAKKHTGSNTKLLNMEVPHFHNVVQVKDMWMCNKKLRELGFKQRYTVLEAVEEVCL